MAEGGGVELGSMFFQLALKNTIKQDITPAEQAVTSFEKRTETATRKTDQYSDSVLNSQMKTMLFGTSLLAAGTAMNTSATALTRLNVISSDTADVLRVAATGLDSVAMAAMSWPQIAKFGSLLSSQLAPALQSVAASAITARGALTALASATAIGAAITGGILLYQAFEEAAKGTRALNDQIKGLDVSLQNLRLESDVYDSKLAEQKPRVEGLKDALSAYDQKIKEVNGDLAKSKDIEEELSDAALSLEGAYLDKAEAVTAYQEAIKTGDVQAIKRGKYNVKVATERIGDIQARQTSLTAEKAALATPADLAALQTDRDATYRNYVAAKKAYDDLQAKSADVASRTKTAEYEREIKNMQKEGTSLSQAAYNAGMAAPYSRGVLANVSPTVTAGPDVVGTARMAMLPNIGAWAASKYALAGSLTTREERNPVLRDVQVDNRIIVNVNSVQDVDSALKASTESQKRRLDLARSGVSL